MIPKGDITTQSKPFVLPLWGQNLVSKGPFESIEIRITVFDGANGRSPPRHPDDGMSTPLICFLPFLFSIPPNSRHWFRSQAPEHSRPSQPTCPASPPPSWTSSSVQTAKNTTRSGMKSVASSILLTQSTPSGTRTSATAKLMPSTSKPWEKRKQRGQRHGLLGSQHHTRTTFLILRKAGCDGFLQAPSCFRALTDGASLEVILDGFPFAARKHTTW
jgi:hypothetical protein